MDVKTNKQPALPVEQPVNRLSSGLEDVIRMLPPGMQEQLRRMLQVEGLDKLQSFLRRMSEIVGEQAKAAEIMRMVLEEQQLIATLRKLKLQDIEMAQELLKGAKLHLEQVDIQNLSLAQAAAVALVSSAFLPVPLKAKPETAKGVTDGHSAATNHLQRMRDFAN